MRPLADSLGLGIYTPSEAAFYARVSPKVMHRWVFGDKDGQPVIKRQYCSPADDVVTFLDFIQTLAVREVRNRHGLSLQKIRKGIDAARERYGIEYPLAKRHTIYLFSDQHGGGHGEMVIKLPDDKDPIKNDYVQLTGKDEKNYLMVRVVEMFLDDLEFDPGTGLASLYEPITHKGAKIVLDPRRLFGEPVVEPGGYTARTLWNATNTEGGIEEAAEAYGVGREEVEVANIFYDNLMRRRIA